MVSSSRPSSPCTIRTRWAPRWRITPSMRSARLASASPTTSRRTWAGLAIGPRMLNTVGTPSSRRLGPAWRMAGWNRGAKQNAMPGRLDAARHLLGRELEADAERLQQVGRPARRRRRPVAVLAHGHPGPGHHERGQGGDVDGVAAVAAGADDVDQLVAPGVVHLDQGGRRRAWRRAGRSAPRPSRPSCAGRRRSRRAGPGWRPPRGSRSWPPGWPRPAGRAGRGGGRGRPASRRAPRAWSSGGG